VVRPDPQPAFGERVGQVLGAAPGGAVHDAGTATGLDLGHRPVDHRGGLGGGVGVPVHLEPDLGTVEPGDDDLGVAHLESLDDLGAHRRRGGGGEREHRRVAQLLDDAAEPEVVGPEVVPPGRDAVGLVDDEHRGLRVPHGVDHLRLGQLLGRQEDEADRSVRQRREHLALLPVGKAGVEPDGAAHRAAQVGQPVDLVALERDERRDHHDRPVQEQAGHLVDRRLARTGREDGERVAAADDGLHRPFLAGPELLEPEDLAGHLPDPPRADGGGAAGGVLGLASACWHRAWLPGVPAAQTVPFATRRPVHAFGTESAPLSVPKAVDDPRNREATALICRICGSTVRRCAPTASPRRPSFSASPTTPSAGGSTPVGCRPPARAAAPRWSTASSSPGSPPSCASPPLPGPRGRRRPATG
jgi:hypothetical protein